MRFLLANYEATNGVERELVEVPDKLIWADCSGKMDPRHSKTAKKVTQIHTGTIKAIGVHTGKAGGYGQTKSLTDARRTPLHRRVVRPSDRPFLPRNPRRLAGSS